MSNNTCVCCGRQIAEGSWVCAVCKNKAMKMPQIGKEKKTAKEKHYTVTDSYLRKLVKIQAQELLTKAIMEFRDQELPMIREDVRKVISLYQAIYRDVLGDMGLLTRDNMKEVLDRTSEKWAMVDALIVNGNLHELQKYAESLGADEDTFLGDLFQRDGDPEEIAEIILNEEDLET